MSASHPIEPPVLETTRLVLRAPRSADESNVVAGIAASLEAWRPFLASAAGGDTPSQQFAKRLTRSTEGWASGARRDFMAFDRASGAYVGDAGVGDIVRGATWEGKIGWRVTAQAQGRGLAFEMVSAVIAHAFSPGPHGPNLHRLDAAILASNTRSIALALRLGFAYEGTKRGLIRIGTRWHDHQIYGLINQAWSAPD